MSASCWYNENAPKRRAYAWLILNDTAVFLSSRMLQARQWKREYNYGKENIYRWNREETGAYGVRGQQNDEVSDEARERRKARRHGAREEKSAVNPAPQRAVLPRAAQRRRHVQPMLLPRPRHAAPPCDDPSIHADLVRTRRRSHMGPPTMKTHAAGRWSCRPR